MMILLFTTAEVLALPTSTEPPSTVYPQTLHTNFAIFYLNLSFYLTFLLYNNNFYFPVQNKIE